MKNNEQYQGIIKHPYIERQGKPFIFANNATVFDIKIFVIIMDIAENMCTCEAHDFEKLLPVFKEAYSLVGDADKEIQFIKEQRKL